MQSGRNRTTEPTASRRQLRPPRRSGPPRWLPRGAVLVALAGATIAVPVLEARTPEAVAVADVVAVTPGPTAYEVLAGGVEQVTPTSLLAAVRGAERVSNTVSRSVDRSPLPGCEGDPGPADLSNGQIPSEALCVLWDGTHMLRGDAAVALTELNGNFGAAFGRDLCVTDSYRSLAAQRSVAARKPGLAARPGTSNHGWGLAIDLCGSETASSAVMSWLSENGPTFGWHNPPWARRGGSGPYEPWHWEYEPGTVEKGTNWGS